MSVRIIYDPVMRDDLFTRPDDGRRIVLHVGSGERHPARLHPASVVDQWREIRVDIDPRVGPDIVASITDLSVVRAETCDAVWSSHNIEHLYPHEVPIALAEFRRVLKPGGFVLIAVPDLRVVARAIAEDKLEEPLYTTAAGPVSALDMLYGHGPALKSGNHFMAHKTGFTPRSLHNAITKAGFPAIDVFEGRFEILAQGRLTASPAVRD